MSDPAASPSRPALTVRAQARVDNGETSGAGTDVCSSCGGPKEIRRINSDKCQACNYPAARTSKGREVTHAMKVSLPPDVYAALAADAALRDRSAATHVEHLLTRKYRKP